MSPSAKRFLRSLCALLLLLGTFAQSAERRIAILVTPAREPLTSLATLSQRGLTLAAQAQQDLRVVDLVAEAAPMEAARTRAAAQEAHSALTKARELLDSNSLAEAARSANVAITRFEESDLEHSMDGLVEAFALSAAIAVKQGEVDVAREILTRLFAARPGAGIEPGLLTPALRNLVQEVRTVVANKPRSTLSVRTTPPGASAFVDGLFVGVTPIELTSLPAGDHYLTVKHPGYSSAQERLVLGEKLKLALPLQPANNGETLVKQHAALEFSTPNAALRSDTAGEIGRWGKLDEVWLGRTEGRPGKYVLRVYRLSGTGRQLGTAELSLQNARLQSADTFEPIVAAFREQPAVAKGKGGDSDSLSLTEPAAKKPFLDLELNQRTWSYLAMGGTAVIAGTGLIMGLSAKSKANDAKSIARSDAAAYPGAYSRATKQARIADALFIAAGAGAITSAVLYLTSQPPKAPPTRAGAPGDLSWTVAPTSEGAAAAVSGSF